jgi:hypothetical protein
MRAFLSSLLIAATFITPTFASRTPGFSVGASAGSLGARGQVGYLFNETFGIRATAGGGYYYKRTLEFKNTKYHNVKVRPITFLLLADWYFIKGWGFRVTGGAGYNRNKITLHKHLTLHDILRNKDQTQVGTVRSKYRFRPFVPYAAAGYDSPRFFNERVSFSLEAGLFFQGKARPDVKLTGLVQDNQALKRQVKKESDKLINRHSWVKAYPVVSLGINVHI